MIRIIFFFLQASLGVHLLDESNKGDMLQILEMYHPLAMEENTGALS